jgi:AcrR family transcriptional regulator
MSNPLNDTPQTRKEREYADHHQAILSAAETLFAENGYHQSTMQMVADKAEFSVGYIYKHFESKEVMYQEMVQFHLGCLNGVAVDVEKRGLDPLTEIYEIYREICLHFNSYPDFMRIFHEGIGGEAGQITEGKKRHFDIIVEKLSQAQAAGLLKPCDTKILAAAMQGATKELFAELANRGGATPFNSLPKVLFDLLIEPMRN